MLRLTDVEIDVMKNDFENNNIRILGYNFVKNNRNKANLIINNKKYKLSELIKGENFTGNVIKIGIILSKYISNFGEMFKNCSNLLELSICNNIINIDDNEEHYKQPNKSEEYPDYDYYYNYKSKNIYENLIYIGNFDIFH